MKPKRFVTLIVDLILVSFVLVVFFACQKQPQNVRSVGAILPLTGDAAAYGKSMQRGMDLALQETNASSSSQLIVNYEDSQADPKLALSAFRILVDRYHVKAIIGPFTSPETFAVAPVAEKDKVVILSTGASAPGITNAGDYIFRIVTSDLFDGAVVARFAKQKLSLHKIAIIYNNNDYGVGVRDAFSKRFRELGGIIVLAEGYLATDTDFRTLLTKIKATDIDGLFLVGYKEMGKVLREARQLGIRVPVLSTGLFEDPDILKTAGNAAEGVYYSYASYNPNSTVKIVRNFVKTYRGKYNSAPDILAALGYDAVRVIAQAYTETGLHSSQIRDQLYKIRNFAGVTGDMSFDNNGDVLKSFDIKSVRNGKFVWIAERF